jgi:hypothetical protein
MRKLLSNMLIWLGVIEILYGFYTVGDEGSVSRYAYVVIIVGVIMSLLGYFIKTK